MPIPPDAVLFDDPLDPQEILDFVFPLLPLLEDDEGISSPWTLTLLPEAIALGLEIIENDGEYPDPHLIEGDTAVEAWFRVDQAFAGNAAFQGSGTPLPMELTLMTTATPPRKRQRTFLMRVKEQ